MNNKVVPIGNYILDKKIGKGSFAHVYRCYHKKNINEKYAIKVINTENLKQKIIDNFKLEIEILKKISHENIVKLYDIFEIKSMFYLVIDYCDRGDLNMFIKKYKKLSYEHTKFFYQQIVKGMKYLYDNNIIHRDLKPQNILLCSSGIAKITDFGLVTVKDENIMMNTICGSPLYMAPEIMNSKSYGQNVDLWSAGILLYEMLIGEPPFKAGNVYQLIKNIKEGNIYFPLDIPNECKELILTLLKINPNERITFYDFFNHPFVNIEKNEKIEEKSIILSKYSTIASIKIYTLKIFQSVKTIIFLINEKYYFNFHSIVLYIYSLKLLTHAIEVIINIIKDYFNTELQEIEKKYREYYNLILNDAEKVYKYYQNYEKIKIIGFQEIIYYNAIGYFKSGLTYEFLDSHKYAKKYYKLGIELLESLSMDETPLLDNDQKIIYNFIDIMVQRWKICDEKI